MNGLIPESSANFCKGVYLNQYHCISNIISQGSNWSNMVVAWYQTGKETYPELIVIQVTDAYEYYTSWGTNVFTDVPM